MVSNNHKITKKVAWIVQFPNIIYVNIFNSLTKLYPEIEFTMIVGNEQKERMKGVKFKVQYLKKYQKIFRLIFVPIVILRFLIGKRDTEITSLTYFKGMGKFLKKYDPDVVAANVYYRPATWQAAWHCKKTNTPLILNTEIKQFPKDPFAKFLVKLTFKILKKMFEQSRFILSWTRKGEEFGKQYFPVTNKSKIHTLLAGVDTEIFKKVKVKRDRNKIIKLLIVARLISYKRHNDLLNALHHLKTNYPDVKFELGILGSGPLKENIESSIISLNLTNEVKFLNRVPYSEINKVYCSHDILVLPSYNEAIGMVVPEAMACGLPVIVSDTCGAVDYVDNNKNGYIFKTADHIDLAKKILQLREKKKRDLFGKLSQKLIQEKYGVDSIAKQFYGFIEKSFCEKDSK
ncbi:glycosyltransferase family 4 protein [Candidatus Woesearchaeota archaeon]|jgi:glycosyltransferase involved in cell wall biosynthesis|nr:glycosyltransferase family 4 protein [Candidatus Woesearchaeota archaeon]MBT3538429.1 glycosyltransferase family 4 protein [Candidatus Woesearchaeota archaeon]MBT7106115.1 glycosyltransferase family 4 protein [Candidatus Woesearchaeota archaeon]MBT7930987.1 glycosyltransferase family 4 protein [Candidatus Woesearchaeota archaeon]